MIADPRSARGLVGSFTTNICVTDQLTWRGNSSQDGDGVHVAALVTVDSDRKSSRYISGDSVAEWGGPMWGAVGETYGMSRAIHDMSCEVVATPPTAP